jgi:hypothetical protein
VRESIVVIAVCVLSSAAACLLGARRRGARMSHVPAALAFTLEAIGLGVIFFTVNVGMGVAAGIASRALDLGFFPLYLVGDWILPVLSLLQGVTFRRWLASRERASG